MKPSNELLIRCIILSHIRDGHACAQSDFSETVKPRQLNNNNNNKKTGQQVKFVLNTNRMYRKYRFFFFSGKWAAHQVDNV